MTGTYRIVVGVDGSEGGRRALAWAVHEAAARGGTVQAVAAWQWDALDVPPRLASPEQERAQAARHLEEQVEAVAGPAGVTIATELVEGAPAEVLTTTARDADLLVLGSHGHSRLHHTVLGSVSEACVRRATCPVVVIPVPQPAVHTSADPAVRI